MTTNEKMQTYENLFHHINYCMLTGNHETISEILQVISDWSYAHRAGNGELTDKEIEDNINEQLKRMESFFGEFSEKNQIKSIISIF